MMMKSKPYLKYAIKALFLLALPNFLTHDTFAGVDGGDHRSFHPAVTIVDYVTVKSTKTLGQKTLSTGLFFDRGINTIPYFEDTANTDTDDTSKSLNDTTESATLLLGYGITKAWDIGIALPFVLAQVNLSDDYHGRLYQAGQTGIRLTSKLRLLSGKKSLAIALGAFHSTVEKDPYFGESAGPAYSLEILPEWHFDRVSLSLNIGYKFRQPGKEIEDEDGFSPIKPLGDQALLAFGVKTAVTQKTKLLFEMYGAKNQEPFSNLSKRKNASIEALLGLKYALTSSFTGHIGYGQEVIHSISSADKRFYAGLYWQPKMSKSARQTKSHYRRSYAKKSKTAKKTVKSKKPYVKSFFRKVLVSIEDDEAKKHVVIAPKTQKTKQHKTQSKSAVFIPADDIFKASATNLDKKAARKSLASIVNRAKKLTGESKLVIEGHNADESSDKENIALSRKQAKIVKNFLTKEYALPSDKIVAVGFGAARSNESIHKKDSRFLIFNLYQ